MSYAHILGTMYEYSSCMIFSVSCMINVDHTLYHDPYDSNELDALDVSPALDESNDLDESEEFNDTNELNWMDELEEM